MCQLSSYFYQQFKGNLVQMFASCLDSYDVCRTVLWHLIASCILCCIILSYSSVMSYYESPSALQVMYYESNSALQIIVI